MTAEQKTVLVKELKNWQEIREAKENVVLNLVFMALAEKKKNNLGWRLKNTITENLVVERDAQYRVNRIKEQLGIR